MSPELASIITDKLLTKRSRRAARRGITLSFDVETRGQIADAVWLGTVEGVFQQLLAIEVAAGSVIPDA